MKKNIISIKSLYYIIITFLLCNHACIYNALATEAPEDTSTELGSERMTFSEKYKKNSTFKRVADELCHFLEQKPQNTYTNPNNIKVLLTKQAGKPHRISGYPYINAKVLKLQEVVLHDEDVDPEMRAFFNKNPNKNPDPLNAKANDALGLKLFRYLVGKSKSDGAAPLEQLINTRASWKFDKDYVKEDYDASKLVPLESEFEATVAYYLKHDNGSILMPPPGANPEGARVFNLIYYSGESGQDENVYSSVTIIKLDIWDGFAYLRNDFQEQEHKLSLKDATTFQVISTDRKNPMNPSAILFDVPDEVARHPDAEQKTSKQQQQDGHTQAEKDNLKEQRAQEQKIADDIQKQKEKERLQQEKDAQEQQEKDAQEQKDKDAQEEGDAKKTGENKGQDYGSKPDKQSTEDQNPNIPDNTKKGEDEEDEALPDDSSSKNVFSKGATQKKSVKAPQGVPKHKHAQSFLPYNNDGDIARYLSN